MARLDSNSWTPKSGILFAGRGREREDAQITSEGLESPVVHFLSRDDNSCAVTTEIDEEHVSLSNISPSLSAGKMLWPV